MKKIKITSIGIFVVGIIFSQSVFGIENNLPKFDANYSSSYIEWSNLPNEEKQNTIIPKTYVTEVPKSVLNKYKNKRKQMNLLVELKSIKQVGNILELLTANSSDSYYNLKDHMNIVAKNQAGTNLCWAVSIATVLETNIALKSGSTELMDFSERHMEYATSRTFTDGINEKGFNRDVGEGGLPVMGLAYLTNGQGAVLESDMPFVNNEEIINLSEINKPVNTVVTEYRVLPNIGKEYNSDGTVTYTKENGTEYSRTRGK